MEILTSLDITTAIQRIKFCSVPAPGTRLETRQPILHHFGLSPSHNKPSPLPGCCCCCCCCRARARPAAPPSAGTSACCPSATRAASTTPALVTTQTTARPGVQCRSGGQGHVMFRSIGGQEVMSCLCLREVNCRKKNSARAVAFLVTFNVPILYLRPKFPDFDIFATFMPQVFITIAHPWC